MNDFQETLSKILSSPEDMQKIALIAEGLGFGQKSEDESPEPPVTPQAAANANPLASLDPELMGKIMKMMSAYNGKSDKAALIEALSPYMEQRQQNKLKRAADYAKLARAARTLFIQQEE